MNLGRGRGQVGLLGELVVGMVQLLEPGLRLLLARTWQTKGNHGGGEKSERMQPTSTHRFQDTAMTTARPAAPALAAIMSPLPRSIHHNPALRAA